MNNCEAELSLDTLYPYFNYSLPPFLDKEDEKYVVMKAKNGDAKAIEKLVLCNVRYINKKAALFVGNGLELADLTQEGILGLLDAIDKFEPDKNIRFITYADRWITLRISRYVKTKGNTIPYNSSDSTYYNRYFDVAEKLKGKLGRRATWEEIASEMHIDLWRLKRILAMRSEPRSLDDYLTDDDKEFTLESIIADPNVDIQKTVEEKDIDERIKKFYDDVNLTFNERFVIYMRYGFDGSNKGATREVIARILKVSNQRICQIEKSALEKIRKVINQNLETGTNVELIREMMRR